MNFEEWFDNSEDYGEDYCDGFDAFDLRKAWNAALKQVVSKRECYQRGYKAGFDKALDECKKLAILEAHKAPNFLKAMELADKIKELKNE